MTIDAASTTSIAFVAYVVMFLVILGRQTSRYRNRVEHGDIPDEAATKLPLPNEIGFYRYILMEHWRNNEDATLVRICSGLRTTLVTYLFGAFGLFVLFAVVTLPAIVESAGAQ